MIYDTLHITIVFLLINYVLLILNFVVNPSNINFIPYKRLKYNTKQKILVSSRVVKFIADWALVCLVLLGIKSFLPSNMATIILQQILFFWIAYQVYYHAIRRLYNKQPVTILDYKLVALAFEIVYHGYLKYFILVILSIIGLYVSLYFFSHYFIGLLYFSDFHFSFIILLVTIVALGLISLYKRRGLNGQHNKRIFFLSYIQYHDIKQSIKIKNLLAKIKQEGLPNYNKIVSELALEKRPNIYFIFIESYGKALYDLHPEEYQKLCDELEHKLSDKNWKVTSNLSEAPRMGGGSWMCYASFLYGTLITDESFFRIIMNEKETIESNISILHALEKSGYDNYLLNPLTGFQDMQIKWDEIKEFFAAKSIFKFSDMDYSGQLTGAMGRQPPDQYSLHKAYDLIPNKEQPHTLFFETINSHAPWKTPVTVEDDWQKTNDPNYHFEEHHKEYFPAIKYQISFIIDFINKKLNNDDIVILIGDHQPPLITNVQSGKETPVHIISKNHLFLKLFEDYGFEEGMWIKEREKNNVTHPGMYYILLRCILEQFGKNKNIDLPYLKNGISIK